MSYAPAEHYVRSLATCAWDAVFPGDRVVCKPRVSARHLFKTNGMKDPGAFDFDGEYGEEYDDLVARVIPGYDQFFQATLALLQTQLRRDAHILIVGCGTGQEIATFAPIKTTWRFTAVDPSIQMVRATQALVDRLGIQDRVTVHHAFTHDLPPKQTFDAATVVNVMHFLQDDGAKKQLIKSVARRIKPGAPVALFDLHGSPLSPSFKRYYDAWIQFMELRGYRGEARDLFLQRLHAGIVFVPEERIMEICSNAGLKLLGRYWAGLLYGGWLLERQITP